MTRAHTRLALGREIQDQPFKILSRSLYAFEQTGRLEAGGTDNL